MLNDIKIGLKGFLAALGFIRRNGLSYYFLFPIVISILVIVALFLVKGEIIDFVNNFFTNTLGLDHTKDDFKGWMGKILRILIAITIWVAITYIFWVMNKYIVLIALSPMLALLSEKTEEILTGKKFPFSFTQLLSDAMRGVGVALRNMVLEVFFIVVFTILGILIPILTPFLFLLMFIISAYFYGFSMMDYISERHKLSLRQGVRFVRQNRGMAFANGAIFDLLMRIPVIGVIFAPIIGCVGATLAVHQKYNLSTSIKPV
jgi:CysZ protein